MSEAWKDRQAVESFLSSPHKWRGDSRRSPHHASPNVGPLWESTMSRGLSGRCCAVSSTYDSLLDSLLRVVVVLMACNTSITSIDPL